MKKQDALRIFIPDLPLPLSYCCNFCVGSNVFLAKGLYLCYTYFK